MTAMTAMMRGRGRAVPVAALLWAAGAACAALLAAPAPQTSHGAGKGAGNERADYVGTWRLVRVELLGPAGDRLPAPAAPAFGSPSPVGLLFHGPGGRFAVTIMQSGRRPFAGAQPTPDEAKAALDGFIAYFGTYSATRQAVTHRVEGSVVPNESGVERQLAVDRPSEGLALSGTWGHAATRARLVWERLPALSNPTATQARFAGFWQRVARERRTLDGKVVDTDQGRQPGILVFSPSGYMSVHSMQPGRTRWAGAMPTPAEARLAIDTYGSAYFGPVTVHEAEKLEVTKQIGLIPPGQVGSDARRHFEFPAPDRLILKPPVEKTDRGNLQAFVHWERVEEWPAGQ